MASKIIKETFEGMAKSYLETRKKTIRMVAIFSVILIGVIIISAAIQFWIETLLLSIVLIAHSLFQWFNFRHYRKRMIRLFTDAGIGFLGCVASDAIDDGGDN
jgi:uncharacterized protein HemY